MVLQGDRYDSQRAVIGSVLQDKIQQMQVVSLLHWTNYFICFLCVAQHLNAAPVLQGCVHLAALAVSPAMLLQHLPKSCASVSMLFQNLSTASSTLVSMLSEHPQIVLNILGICLSSQHIK